MALNHLVELLCDKIKIYCISTFTFCYKKRIIVGEHGHLGFYFEKTLLSLESAFALGRTIARPTYIYRPSLWTSGL